MIIMLLPVIIFIFLMGWSMYWIGDQKRQDKIKRKPLKKDNITIMPIVYEETQEIMNA